MQVLYLDGCPCCPCCGSLIIEGFGYEATDPSPYIYPLPNSTSTARWYNEDGTLASTSSLSSSGLSGLPSRIDTSDPPATITVTTTVNISTVLACGVVKLPAGTQLLFRSTGGGRYQSDAVVVCNE